MSDIDIKEYTYMTAPRDPKNFPATNQAHYCWQKYNEFVLATKVGASPDKIFYTRKMAKSICPDEWVEQWDEQRENGNFLGVQPKKEEE